MNVTVQADLEGLEFPDLQLHNSSCDITIHLVDDAGAVLTYTKLEKRRCVTMHAVLWTWPQVQM